MARVPLEVSHRPTKRYGNRRQTSMPLECDVTSLDLFFFLSHLSYLVRLTLIKQPTAEKKN